MKSHLSAVLCTLIFFAVGTSADTCAAQCKQCPNSLSSPCTSITKHCRGEIIETLWSTSPSGSSAQLVTSIDCCNCAPGATDMNCSLSHGVTTGFQHCHSLGAEVEFGGLGAEWTITQNNELCWNNTSTNTVSNESTVPGGSAVRLSLFRLAVIVDVTTKITYYRVSTIDTSNCEQPAKPPVYILTSTCETVYEESQTTMWTYQIESEAIACPCP